MGITKAQRYYSKTHSENQGTMCKARKQGEKVASLNLNAITWPPKTIWFWKVLSPQEAWMSNEHPGDAHASGPPHTLSSKDTATADIVMYVAVLRIKKIIRIFHRKPMKERKL